MEGNYKSKKHYNVGSGNVSVFSMIVFSREGQISQPSHESKSSCLIRGKQLWISFDQFSK